MPTTIQLKEPTLKRLKAHKITARQSYDEILNRLLDEVEEEILTADEIDEIQRALEDVRKGRVAPIEDVAVELGIDLHNV